MPLFIPVEFTHRGFVLVEYLIKVVNQPVVKTVRVRDDNPSYNTSN